VATIDGARKYDPPKATGASEGGAAVSPDGGWIAYQSDRSGQFEIYVERFPDRAQRQKISQNGGHGARWSPDGRELFYLTLDGRRLMAVPVRVAPTFTAGQEVTLFEGQYMRTGPGVRPYDVMRDGKRFVMIKPTASAGTASREIVVVQHWTEELKRLVQPH
jgi:hypothetical protein